MAKIHGRVAVVKLDDLAGALQDISAYLTNSGYGPSTDRPETQTFGQGAKRRGVLGLRDGGALSLQGFWQASASAKVHGRNTGVLIDAFNLGSYFKTTNVKRMVDLPETQTFGDSWKEHGVTGLADGSLSLGGFYDSAAAGPEAYIRAALGSAVAAVVTVAPNGFTIGNLVDMLQGMGKSESWPSDENNVTEISAEFDADDYVDMGISLHDLVAEVGAAPVNYASVDETAATALGGVAHLHVTAFTGTTATIKVQHSTDNAVWNDLITFTAATGVTSQRVELGATTTVNRYVRAQVATGTYTSITFVVAFARRGYAYGTAGTYRHFCGLLQLAASSTFEYGPEGGTTGKRRYTGECRLASLDVTYDENDVTKFSSELQVDGAITENTFP